MSTARIYAQASEVLKAVLKETAMQNEEIARVGNGPVSSFRKLPPASASLSPFSSYLRSVHAAGRIPIGPYTATYPSNKGDTLWVGIAPYVDSLVITGSQTYNWPIIVVGNALLRFKNANATIHGDLLVLGNGRVLADHSTLHFPQQYFYQRHITLVQNASLIANNDTLDYGGFVHSLSINDSARGVFNRIYQTDFMTTGLSSKASISVNTTNIAGEYIMEDRATFSFKHCTTLLLWHQCPDTAVINWSFPKGDSVYNYKFNNALPGVKGICYHASADSCYKVMWGLMPTNGSDVTISNSVIRTIGLWFQEAGTVTVSGLADQSRYLNFQAPISDRTLKLVNDSVVTWSLYPMNKSKLRIFNCTAGEIGTYGTSQVLGNVYSCDGTGGYHYSSDSSGTFANQLIANCNVRSEHAGIFVLDNSMQNYGTVTAIGNSVMIVLQSTLTADPVPLEGSAAWLGNISQVSSATIDTGVEVSGSAWITRTAVSKLMDFANYQLFYRPQSGGNWIPVTSKISRKVSNGVLGTWNTQGLPTGTYTLNLKLTDTWGDTANAMKNVTLGPRVLEVHELLQESGFVKIYPNPSSGQVTLGFSPPVSGSVLIELFDIDGKLVRTFQQAESLQSQTTVLLLNMEGVNDGLYFCRISSKEGIRVKKISILRE